MWVALIAAAYLLGTFPSADLVASASGVDITTTGSGNPGASNVTRALGWRKGVLVFVLDALKGALATADRTVARWPGRWLRARWGGDRRPHLPDHTTISRWQGRRHRGRSARRPPSPRRWRRRQSSGWRSRDSPARRRSPRSPLSSSRPIGLALTGAPAWEFAATVGLCALLVVRHAGNIRRMLRREEHAIGRSSAR